MSPKKTHRKCLLVSPDFPPPFEGGSLVYVYNLLRHCPEKFDILTSCSEDATDDLPHTVIRKKFLFKSFDPARWQLAVMYSLMPLWILLRSFIVRYDVIVGSAGVVGNCIVAVIARFLRIPVVGVGYAEEITIPLSSRGWKSFFKRTFMKYMYPKFDGFITVCDFTKRALESLGLSAEKIGVIPPMVDDKKKCHAVHSSVSNHHILSVGRLVKRKGFDYLIESVNLLKKDIPGIKLSIVGRGPEREKLEDIICKHNLEDNVFLRGNLDDGELSKLYQECSLFVLSNVTLENGDTEGCPTVFLEACAGGMPVIGGIDGGTSCAIEDGFNGYLADSRNTPLLAEKIKTILTDPLLARKLGEGGKMKVQRDHDAKQAGPAMGLFLEKIVNGKHRRN